MGVVGLFEQRMSALRGRMAAAQLCYEDLDCMGQQGLCVHEPVLQQVDLRHSCKQHIKPRKHHGISHCCWT